MMNLDLVLTEELESFREKGLLRRLRTLSNPAGARASLHGKEIVLFCGNDYLGLSHHPRVIQAASEALQKYGLGAGAARLISGTTEAHSQLEKELAHFKNKDQALVFGSGYLANLGVLSGLAGEKDLIVMDKLCHASLIDGAKLSGATLRIFPHKNDRKLEEILKKSGGFRRRFLVSDSVFSMDGDRADLETLIRLKEKYGVFLIIDDAHGIGVFGPHGKGATEGFEEKIDCITATLSKSLGVFGGWAAASSLMIENLIHFSRPFIFATAPPPVLAEAALESLSLIQNEPAFRKKLWQNVDRVQSFLSGLGFSFEDRSPIIPIILGEEKETVRISEELLKKGVLIPAIRYPAVPKGKARLRLTVSAIHNEEDFKKLFEAFSGIFSHA